MNKKRIVYLISVLTVVLLCHQFSTHYIYANSQDGKYTAYVNHPTLSQTIFSSSRIILRVRDNQTGEILVAHNAEASGIVGGGIFPEKIEWSKTQNEFAYSYDIEPGGDRRNYAVVDKPFKVILQSVD